ncbi:MAG: HAD-IA family hydrolase [Prochloraceae cyanobacterium]|nr:HAD-IA family hydrolase [Prochloraceae cyanobacterium]
MLSAILFDLDGTLVNTDDLHFQTWQDALRELKIEIDRPFYNQKISGRTNEQIVRDILPQLPFETGLKIAHDKEANFRNLAGKLTATPGLDKILNWVKNNDLKKAVVTNAPRDNAKFMLEALALTETFETVILAEDAPRGKPDPAPYQLALKRLQIEKDRAIVFEDSPSGLRSAKAAGIYTIGVASGHEPEYLLELGADRVIDDFTDRELWQWLETMV